MSGLAVALDSNLLLLFVVGNTSRDLIAKHKRLREFDTEDYDLLRDQLSAATQIIVTPNTLTETSNLIDHIAEPARGQIYGTLRALVANPATRETYVPSVSASRRAELPRLGLTDCALLELVAQGLPLITVNLRLFLAAIGSGGKALNFNHLRDR